MRRRLLSTLLALCMVLSLLSTTAHAAQVKLSVGDSTTVSLLGDNSTILISYWSITGDTDAVKITSSSKTSCTVKAVAPTGGIDANVHCEYRLHGSNGLHLYDVTISVGNASGGSSSTGTLSTASDGNGCSWSLYNGLQNCTFTDTSSRDPNAVQLDLANPGGVTRSMYCSWSAGNLHYYGPNYWDCWKSGDGFEVSGEGDYGALKFVRPTGSDRDGYRPEFTFKPLRVGEYFCTLTYYVMYNGNYKELGFRTIRVSVTCSHKRALRGALRETADSDGYTGDVVCVLCGETLEEGHSIKTVASGRCGPDLTWLVNDQGLLRIEGGGDMDDFTTAPWYDYRAGIQNVEIGQWVSSIGANAFAGCTALGEFSVPGRVRRVGANAFGGCSSGLTPCFLGDAPEIAPDAFAGVNNALVYYIDGRAGWRESNPNDDPIIWQDFGGSLMWKDATLYSGSCGENANWTLDRFGTMTITGSGPTTDYASYNIPWRQYKTQIETVVVEEGITRLGNYSFCGCTELADVMLADSLSVIGDYAFSDCSSLFEFQVSSNTTEIGKYAFSGCSGLNAIDLSYRLRSLGENAFKNCAMVRTLELPASITEIGSYAFSGCTRLEEVTLRGDAPTINSNAFSGVEASVKYPYTNSGWIDSVLAQYGGNLVWEPYKAFPLSNYTFSLPDSEFLCTGSEIHPSPVVQRGSTVLEEGTDYRVYYSDCVDPGEAEIAVVGTGSYSGVLTGSFWILPTVRFDPNGGTVNVSRQAIRPGSVYGTLPEAVWSGFGFAGWYTERSGGQRVTAETVVTQAENHVLYAHWGTNELRILNPVAGGNGVQYTVQMDSASGEYRGILVAALYGDGMQLLEVQIRGAAMEVPISFSRRGASTKVMWVNSVEQMRPMSVSADCVLTS